MGQPQLAHRPPQRSVLEAYVNVTGATYTVKGGDRVVGVNRSGAVTVTLPTAQVRKGRVYTIKDESGAAATNNITIDTEGSETIDGSATDVIASNYEVRTYYSDGTNWFIIPVIAFDATSPSTQAFGDAAAVGTAAVAARRDHKHAMPADPTADISARAHHNASQSIADSTDTALALNSERWDTDTIHDNSTNNPRLTAKTAGKYIVSGSAVFASNATGRRQIFLKKNGSTTYSYIEWDTNQNSVTSMTITTIIDLAVNDYVELMVRQSSGGGLNINSNGNYTPELSMAKVLG